MILAVDQGTTGTTCLVVDDELQVRGRGHAEVSVQTPRPGWVEQDPQELWASVERAAEAALADAGVAARELDALGIANQRETTLVWDRRTGEPVYPAIVWQDRRTAERCRELPAELIRTRTGLTPDPYFSATKLEWILRETGGMREGLAFGTVDTWLVWKLTHGAVHATDVTNASRTLLLDLATLDWDDELLALFGVDESLLPAVHGSAEVVGDGELLGAKVPIAALAGDQQASLFAHGGGAKVTLGTGAFLLVGTGGDCSPPPHGLVRTAAAGGGYALEGSIFVAGAAVQWLRDKLGMLANAAESEALARSVDSTEGRLLRAGADRPRLAALGAGRARAGDRPVAEHASRAPRPRGTRGDRVPGSRRRRRILRAARSARRGRRHDRERVPHAVSRRRACASGRRRGRARDDGARRRRTNAPGPVASARCRALRAGSRRVGARCRLARRGRPNGGLTEHERADGEQQRLDERDRDAVQHCRAKRSALRRDRKDHPVHRRLARAEPRRREHGEHRHDRADRRRPAEEDDRRRTWMRVHGAEQEPKPGTAEHPRPAVEREQRRHSASAYRRQLSVTEALEDLGRERPEHARLHEHGDDDSEDDKRRDRRVHAFHPGERDDENDHA